MMKWLTFAIGFSLTSMMAATNVTCPRYSLKCPDCPAHQTCAYPASNGCENSGRPVCQAYCFGIQCLVRAMPCPDACPHSCKYHGPPCCPFLGVPTCEDDCPAGFDRANCPVTPCPEACAEDCFYPNADPCCPYAGEPVCPNKEANGDSSSSSTSTSTDTTTINGDSANANTEADVDAPKGTTSTAPAIGSQRQQRQRGRAALNRRRIVPRRLDQTEEEERSENDENDTSVADPNAAASVSAAIASNDAAAVVSASAQQGKAHREADESDTGTFDDIINQDEEEAVFCIDMIIPCPPECLKSCIYPNNVPCPHLYPPKCPSEVPAPPAVLTIPATDKDKGEPSTLIYEQLSTKVQALIDAQNKLIHDAQGVLHDEESLLELIKQQQKEQQQPATPTERHGEENDAANGDDAQPPASHPHAQQPEYSQTRPSIPVPPLKTVANANPQVAPASSIANSKDTTPLQACPKIYIPCPAKCPKTCERPKNAPCPFAVPGYCP